MGSSAATVPVGEDDVRGRAVAASARWCDCEPNHIAGVSVETSLPTVDLTPLGHALGRHTPELVDDMIDILLAKVVELQGDEQVVGRLRASVESNVAAIQHLLEQPLDIRLVDPPTGAVQWSLRLAQRGIPLNVLWRAYHLCTARVLRFFAEELTRHSDSVEELGARFAAASALLNRYVDHVCERVGTSYESERQRWLRQQDVVRAERISDLIAGRIVDTRQVEAALGYRLAGRHLGSILWDSHPSGDAGLVRLQRWATRSSDRLGCRSTTVWLQPSRMPAPSRCADPAVAATATP